MTWPFRPSSQEPRRLRFFDACAGTPGGSPALPADVRAAAEALDGESLTVSEALTMLMRATEPHGGHLELPGDERRILWYRPDGPAYGDAHVFALISFR